MRDDHSKVGCNRNTEHAAAVIAPTCINIVSDYFIWEWVVILEDGVTDGGKILGASNLGNWDW